MEHWGIKNQKTAQNLMAQFGLTRSYKKATEQDNVTEQKTKILTASINDDKTIALSAQCDRQQREIEQYKERIAALEKQVQDLMSKQRYYKEFYDAQKYKK